MRACHSMHVIRPPTMTTPKRVLPMIALMLFVAAVACNGPAPASHSEGMALTAEDREGIEALARGYSERALAGDFQGWVALYRADAVRMNPGAPPLEGRESIREWVNGLDITVRSHSMSPIEVEGTRELAYIRGTYHSVLSVHVDGEEVTIPDDGSWLAVVRRDEDGAWGFHRFIYNTDLAPAPVAGPIGANPGPAE
jgi:ketosteroid isomerase-like protein